MSPEKRLIRGLSAPVHRAAAAGGQSASELEAPTPPGGGPAASSASNGAPKRNTDFLVPLPTL